MKKGISLIVLVITIIIIIILAGAVILNLADNNPIENASEAAILSEQSDLNSGMTLYLSNLAAKNKTAYKIGARIKTPAVTSTDETTGEVTITKPAELYKEVVGLTLVDGETKLTAADKFYKVTEVSITCGSETVDFETQAKFLEAIGMTSSSYAGGTNPEYTVVVNEGGLVKLAK